MMSDSEEALPVTIGAGANVTDRCIVLPGARIGANACLGSGGLLGKNAVLNPNAVAVGAHNGAPVILSPGDDVESCSGGGLGLFPSQPRSQSSDTVKHQQAKKEDMRISIVTTSLEDHAATNTASKKEAEGLVDVSQFKSIKPFGKAQYFGLRKYYLPSVPIWALINTSITVLKAWVGRTPMLVTWVIVGNLLGDTMYTTSQAAFFGYMLGVYAAVHIVHVLLVLGLDIGCKWLLLGRRQPGNYSWDSSSYNMRWKICLRMQSLKGQVLERLAGTVYLTWYFR